MQISKILCAVNPDPLAESVFAAAFDLAQKLGAELALVSIIDQNLIQPGESGATRDMLRDSVKKEIDQLFRQLLTQKKSTTLVTFCEEGDPKKKITEIASQWNADLIVIASHGRRGIARVLMGSVAEGVLRHTKCPLFIVPAHKS